MLDVKRLYAVSAAVVRQVRLVSLDPAAIEISLADPVDDVVGVRVNDTDVTEFSLTTSTKILAMLPPKIEGISSVKVVAAPRALNNASGRMMVRPGVMAMGADRLVQQILRLFLTRPGSILGHPEVGAFPDLAGVPAEEWPAVVSASFMRVRDQVLKQQTHMRVLMLSEKLVNIEVVQVTRSPRGRGVVITLRIQTMAGNVLHTLSAEV